MSTRASGVLLHLSSLPGPYGIGGMGKNAKEFVRALREMEFSYWQVLPLGMTDAFFSPYKSVSAFAGNPYFIDLDILYEKGLLTRQELLQNESATPYAANYPLLEQTRMQTLRKAFSRIGPAEQKKIAAFSQAHKAWLSDASLYLAIRDANNGADWQDWDDVDLKKHEPKALLKASERYLATVSFHQFLQYEFHTQWQDLKAYANGLGVKIIGDMPIYVSLESADVWSNQHLFKLTQDGKASVVAGVPPDYFTADGQKWGNPIYRWDVMQKDGYAWWKKRLSHALSLYDSLRLDHFRAFSSYYEIPAGDETAKNGAWQKGPGMDFFNQMPELLQGSRIIAEDLGDIDEAVCALLKKTGFPGMRVMQFGFLSREDNPHLPHNYPKNCVAYPGTHDNDTLLGWLFEASPEQREFALSYCRFSGGYWGGGGYQSESCRAMLLTLLQSGADLAILPMQDICGFGADTRMNLPGTVENNWLFRLPPDALQKIDRAWYAEKNRLYCRAGR